MRICFTRAAVSAAFLGLFGVSANGQLIEEPNAPLTGAEEIEAVFKHINTKGTSYFYDGTPSKDLSHLTTRRHPQGFIKKDTTPTWLKPPVKFSDEYLGEVRTLQKMCKAPDLNDPRFNAASWFLENIKTEELPGLRRDFTEALYFSIGKLPDNDEKIEALSRLNRYIPDSAAYIDFLQKKRDQIGVMLKQDKLLDGMDKKWATMPPENKNAILYYVTARILRTLLPTNDLDIPRVHYLVDGVMSAEVDGLYFAKFQEMYINGDQEDIATDYNEALQTTSHEAFHAFQHILINWDQQGKLDGNAQLKRQAKLQYLDTIIGGTGVDYHENYMGYRMSIKERGAWAFQMLGSPQRSMSIATDMFRDFSQTSAAMLATPPVYKYDSGAGKLPQACGDTTMAQFRKFY